MSTSDGFHPDFDDADRLATRNRVHHIKASEISSDTAQTDGLQRFAALSGRSVGAEKLWMGETHVAPETVSANHHHGESETAIYVRSGNPQFVFHDGSGEVRISTQPGDYIFVPPYLPHREENPDPDNPAEVVIARSTQEAIVVNLPELYPL
ncbi:cupin [Mycobacterium sp. 1164966.3]|uniref:cupin domain-containing protein n=1 Tax=Mycobacterium sp. 1164966.3 TaxID=1856861 RepID=UPI0007FD4B16|nr:cupin domain-containing protein [Mycobacterium sp. 1164966.3]OBA81503.1 cupin [Mycobacterium sp. 1164966.3]